MQKKKVSYLELLPLSKIFPIFRGNTWAETWFYGRAAAAAVRRGHFVPAANARLLGANLGLLPPFIAGVADGGDRPVHNNLAKPVTPNKTQ